MSKIREAEPNCTKVEYDPGEFARRMATDMFVAIVGVSYELKNPNETLDIYFKDLVDKGGFYMLAVEALGKVFQKRGQELGQERENWIMGDVTRRLGNHLDLSGDDRSYSGKEIRGYLMERKSAIREIGVPAR